MLLFLLKKSCYPLKEQSAQFFYYFFFLISEFQNVSSDNTKSHNLVILMVVDASHMSYRQFEKNYMDFDSKNPNFKSILKKI